jgi:hypothetical protein
MMHHTEYSTKGSMGKQESNYFCNAWSGRRLLFWKPEDETPCLSSVLCHPTSAHCHRPLVFTLVNIILPIFGRFKLFQQKSLC